MRAVRWVARWRKTGCMSDPTVVRVDPAPIPTESNLVKYARAELTRAGWFAPESEYGGDIGRDVLKLVETLSTFGTSGGSHGLILALFARVASYKPLTPLTANPDEWTEVGDHSGKTLYQSKRQSSCFSYDQGRSYWDIDEPGSGHTNPKATEPVDGADLAAHHLGGQDAVQAAVDADVARDLMPDGGIVIRTRMHPEAGDGGGYQVGDDVESQTDPGQSERPGVLVYQCSACRYATVNAYEGAACGTMYHVGGVRVCKGTMRAVGEELQAALQAAYKLGGHEAINVMLGGEDWVRRVLAQDG